MSDPTDLDRDVRITIAECIRDRGAVPSLAEVVSRVAVREADVTESFGRLAAARVMILRPGTTEILSFNPFAAGPTGFPAACSGAMKWVVPTTCSPWSAHVSATRPGLQPTSAGSPEHAARIG